MHLDEIGGLVELVLLVGEALGLEFLEEREDFFELAGKALAVEAQVRKGAGLGFEGRGDGERLLDLFRGLGELVGDADHAQGKEVVFEGGDSVEAPGGVGQGLDQLGFDGAFGFALVDVGFDVALVGLKVVTWEDDDLTGESMAEGV